MKSFSALSLLLFVSARWADAFAPSAFTRQVKASTSTTRVSAVDPNIFHDMTSHADSLRNAFSSLTVADLSNLATTATDAAQTAVTTGVADTDLGAAASTAQAASGNGWFGFLEGPIEGLLCLIHDALAAVGVTEAWGIAIITMTVLIKVLTFPLTKTQLESTNKMQALQPTIKEIQAKYQSNPEVMNQKISEVYQTNQVNPLAGCLPSFAQIPIFIGLYRAVLTLAQDNKLDEPFLWLPSLEGPTFGAPPAEGANWILKGWTDAGPSLGWDDTVAYLALPVFLVVSQYVSMQIMQPKSDDPQQQQANFILKILPVMIGWFSLSVPSALGIYWAVNNVITTSTTMLVRNSMKMEPVTAAGGTAPPVQSVIDTPATEFRPAPIREKPAGFGATETMDEDAIKPITPIDAEVVAKDVASESDEAAVVEPKAKGPSSQKRGKKKKKKRRS